MLCDMLYVKRTENHAFVRRTVFCIFMVYQFLREAVKRIVVLLTRVSLAHAQLTHALTFFFNKKLFVDTCIRPSFLDSHMVSDVFVLNNNKKTEKKKKRINWTEARRVVGFAFSPNTSC